MFLNTKFHFMKNLILSVLFAITALLNVSAANIIIENPPFSVATHTNVYITKITINDNATYLTMAAHHSPTSWIMIASDTYIRVNGEKFITKSAEGIELDKEVYSDESGKTVFTLKFDPIDPSAKQLDFIESDCANCFKIWGVELKSNVLTNRKEVPEKIKKEAAIKDDGKSLEIPQLKAGSATLKGQFLGYVPEMNWNLELYINNPITGEQEGLETPIQEDGSFEIQVPLVTTMQVLFRTRICNDYILLSPDKETSVYYDLQQKSCQESQHRVDQCPKSKYLYFGGANAEINNQMQDSNILKEMSDLFYNQQSYTDILGMTAEQYKAYILNKVDIATENISQKDLTKKMSEFAMINMRLMASYKLLFANSDLEDAYRRANNIDYRDPITGFIRPVLDENFYSFLKDLNINQPINLYSHDLGFTANSCKYLKTKKVEIFMPNNELYQQLVESGTIDTEDIEIAEYLRKQTWDNWDATRLRLNKEDHIKYVQELINSGKLVNDHLEQANKLLSLLADPSSNNIQALVESRIELDRYLSGNGIFSQDELNNMYESTHSNSKVYDMNPEYQEYAQKFHLKYSMELNKIISKGRSAKNKSTLASILGTSDGIIYDLMEAQLFCSNFEEYTPLTTAELKEVSEMKNQFLAVYIKEKNNQLLAQLEANKDKKGFNVHEVPERSSESFFSDLMKPFAGKVVLVDFWATWCAPCRSAMKEFEPAKNELLEKGVVFVYITDESSPINTWNNMMPTIKGEHFRLKNDQYKILKDKFGINGVPSYLILNKKGEQVYFRVGFEGTDRMTNLLNRELEANP